MNLIKGKRFGQDLYINTEKIVALEPYVHDPKRTNIRCEDEGGYILDLHIEEVLRQISRGKD